MSDHYIERFRLRINSILHNLSQTDEIIPEIAERQTANQRSFFDYITPPEPRTKVRTNKWHIYAIKSGEVYRLTRDGSSVYGNSVIVKDRYGELAQYGHLVNQDYKGGERILEGQVIGIMGSTGRGTGKHLHVSVYPAGTISFSGSNAKINPIYYILEGVYPTNTLISGMYRAKYRDENGEEYNHEGKDFSGNEDNLIQGWEYGISGINGIQYNIDKNKDKWNDFQINNYLLNANKPSERTTLW